MIDSTVQRTPAFADVWSEQLRIAGLSIRREAIAAFVLFGLTCIGVVMAIRIPALFLLIDSPTNLYLDPGEPPFGFFAVVLALLLPLLIWRGERPYGDTPMWSLPVDHRRHALTKVAAGWVWLMVLLGGALLFVVLTALAGGFALGADEVRLLITEAAGADSATRGVAWTTPWWEWLIPFTAATAAYMLVSTLLLATPHPYRWALAVWVLAGMLAGLTEYFEVESLQRGMEVTAWFAGGDTFTRGVRLPSGDRARAWMLLPTMGMWAAAAAFWIGLGFVGVLTGSARARDH